MVLSSSLFLQNGERVEESLADVSPGLWRTCKVRCRQLDGKGEWVRTYDFLICRLFVIPVGVVRVSSLCMLSSQDSTRPTDTT